MYNMFKSCYYIPIKSKDNKTTIIIKYLDAAYFYATQVQFIYTTSRIENKNCDLYMVLIELS